MSDNSEKVDQLKNDAESHLQELELALRKAYLNFEDPTRVGNSVVGKFRALYTRMDTLKGDPKTRSYLSKLQSSVEQERQKMVNATLKAHRDRGPVNSKLASGNNEIGKGLTAAPKGRHLDSQISQTTREMVNAIIKHDQAPSSFRQELARLLAQWIKGKDQVRDAFFVAQSALLNVAEFLHQKLQIQGQIQATRDHVKKQAQITRPQAGEANNRVGELAKRSVALDREILQRIRQSCRGKAHLNPNIVLNPTKALLSRLEAKAGIKLRQNGVTVDIGTRLRVVDARGPQQGGAAITTFGGEDIAVITSTF